MVAGFKAGLFGIFPPLFLRSSVKLHSQWPRPCTVQTKDIRRNLSEQYIQDRCCMACASAQDDCRLSSRELEEVTGVSLSAGTRFRARNALS